MTRPVWRHRAPVTAAVLALALVGATGGAVVAAVPSPQPATPTTPRCFGAASRDALHPCVNPALRRTVRPAPLDALLTPFEPCEELPAVGAVQPCRFGVELARATDEIALIGDSHAGHWRAALRAVALARGYRATSITQTGCPYLDRAPLRNGRVVRRCIRRNAQLPAYLQRHPAIRTVFVGQYTGGLVHHDGFDATVRAYLRGWHRLPATIRRIFVLRDTTARRPATLDCVIVALARHRSAGTDCAVPRSRALLRDPALRAAHLSRDPRLRIVDLSSYSCSRRLCLPVVGGVLVNKDENHMTTQFARTLGPYLLRRVRDDLPPLPATRPCQRVRGCSQRSWPPPPPATTAPGTTASPERTSDGVAPS